MPLGGSNSDESFIVEGRIPRSLEEVGDVEYRVVTSDYFRALSIPLISGREFGPADTGASTRVSIINQALARRYFPGEDPIGKRVTTDDPRSPGAVWLTIIGVAGDVRHRGLAQEPEPEMYVAHQQYPDRGMKFVVRTRFGSGTIVSAVKDEIEALDPNLPIYNIRTMERLVSESVAQQRLSSVLFGIFAAIALGLASIGIYGVVSYSANRRTHEIAIRRALGARPGEILRMVIAERMTLAVAGIGVGLGLAMVLARSLSGLLFRVSHFDPITYAAVAMALLGVALAAIYVPARRATRVDPISGLKYE